MACKRASASANGLLLITCSPRAIALGNNKRCIQRRFRPCSPASCWNRGGSAVDSRGRTIWIADAHRDNGKRFIVRADEKLRAFLELQRVTRETIPLPKCRIIRHDSRWGQIAFTLYEQESVGVHGSVAVECRCLSTGRRTD